MLVFKYKGSVQCNSQSGIPLEDMLSELSDANINVHCSDGSAVVTVYGVDTGVVNVHEKPISSLITAENLNFQ